ncbi:MAG: alpha/beta fold hydrolase [Candidatus Diapherotrites archaeon]
MNPGKNAPQRGRVMKNAIIIHGTEGHPKENWFPWLKEQLEKHGYDVIIPQFPTPKNQNPRAWFGVFKNYEKFLNRDTILIGHSCGGAFLLRVLEKTKTKVKVAVFVAASAGVKPIKYYEADRPFVEAPFDWEKIRNSSGHFFVFHSEDDPLICIANGEKIAKELGVELIRLKDAGHFNSKAGYDKFGLLLEKLEPIL